MFVQHRLFPPKLRGIGRHVVADVQRKMATLLSANVAGYSDRVEASEARVAGALNAYRALFKRLVAEHRGREFGSLGDSRIVEFPSALSALQCAMAIQQTINDENKALPDEERVWLRIGLNVGEVIEEADGNLYGTGVEVAAQVQELAAPGGILLAGSIHDHVKHKAQFESTGEQDLRNITEPVSTYQVLDPRVERTHLALWSELKRRNVFRVAAAYVVVAWLLIQVASIVLPTFAAPDWIMRGLVISVILGFPIAVVLAWIYELTPLGLMRSDDVLRHASIPQLTGRRLDGVVIVLLVMAVVFLVFDNYVSLEAEPDIALQESIAVLAFENLSTDPDDEYFSDGVADEVLSVLARAPEFRVASRTSSFNFKGRDVDAGTIAATLMVDNILEGTVRRDGDQVRVTARLIQDGSILWSERYDRNLDDVLDVQAEIAYSVATAIVPLLSPASVERIAVRPTDNIEAYDYYLRGLDYLNRPDEEATLTSAVGLFGRAIELDPRFAAAWAARCKTRLGQYEFSAGRREYFSDAQADCRQAWTLDNGLWEVYVALGRLYRVSGLYEDAISELESAIALQPNAVEAYLELGTTYSEQNRLEQAELMFERAIEADRGYWEVYRLYGHFLYDNERYQEAIEQYNLVVEFTPDSGIGYDNVGNAYWALGDFDRAATAFESSLGIVPSRWAYSNLGSMQWYLGDFPAAVENQLRAIELAPDSHEAWGRLAEAYRFIPGNEVNASSAYSTAIGLAEKELLVNPDNWLNVALLGQYYTFSDMRNEAVLKTQELLELVPLEPTAYYFDARTKWHHGDMEGVYSALEGALERGFSAVFIATDPDLAPLRDQERFQSLLARYQQNDL